LNRLLRKGRLSLGSNDQTLDDRRRRHLVVPSGRGAECLPRASRKRFYGLLWNSVSTEFVPHCRIHNMIKGTVPRAQRVRKLISRHPSVCVRSTSGILIQDEGATPIRCSGTVAGVVPGPGDGLRGFQHANEHRRTCLLPGDEEPMWPDGNARVAWLLSEDSPKRSR
jgi:hypothetical protein